MYAKNTSGSEAGQGPVKLAFDRQMAKLELKIKGTNLNGLKAVFTAMPTSAVLTFHQESYSLKLM